jgi:hypothetical protein
MESAGVSSLLLLYLSGRFPECGAGCRGAMLSAVAGVWAVASLLLLPPTLRRLGPLSTLRLSLAANVAHCLVYAAAAALWPLAANLPLVAVSAFAFSVIRAVAAASVAPAHAGAALGRLEAAAGAGGVLSPLLFAEAFRLWAHTAHDPAAGPAAALAARYPGAPFALGAVFAAAALLLTAALPPPASTDEARGGGDTLLPCGNARGGGAGEAVGQQREAADAERPRRHGRERRARASGDGGGGGGGGVRAKHGQGTGGARGELGEPLMGQPVGCGGVEGMAGSTL